MVELQARRILNRAFDRAYEGRYNEADDLLFYYQAIRPFVLDDQLKQIMDDRVNKIRKVIDGQPY
jgi:hypothetical protein